METSYYVGIDISKERLDWQLNYHIRQKAMGKAANNPNGIAQLLQQWTDQGIPLDELVVCFEHTGPYGLLLAAMLEEAGLDYVMVSAAEVQRSLGIRRGKSDPIDAGRLAEYGWRFRDRLRPSRLPSKALLEVRGWLLWREKLIKMRTGVINGIKATQLVGGITDLAALTEQMQDQQRQLTEQLKQVDRHIQHAIRKCAELHRLYQLLASIPGIGPVIAGWLLVYTQGFTRFGTARQFACFVGSAPFPHQSGIQKSSDRVSRWRCVRMKTLLLNGVNSAIQHDPEIGAYFRRKCSEGKHPQSVKNAVVCKLIYRVFAVVNRGTPYVKIYQHEMEEIT